MLSPPSSSPASDQVGVTFMMPQATYQGERFSEETLVLLVTLMRKVFLGVVTWRYYVFPSIE